MHWFSGPTECVLPGGSGERVCQHWPGGRAQPSELGKLGHFLPFSQNWAEGDAKRQHSGEVKGRLPGFEFQLCHSLPP